MNEPKWTPGTWTYDPEEAAVVSDHEPHIIAPLFGQCEDADGYLLAASKELYAALEQARTVISLLVRSLPQDESFEQEILEDAEQAKLSAIAALAKARGESQ